MSPEDPKNKTPDAKTPAGQHPPSADDVLDLGHLPPSDGGSASMSQVSGPLSGTSIVAWTDLLRTRTLGEINLDLDGVEIDAESDRDLIDRILAEQKAAVTDPSSRPKTEEFIDLGAAGTGSGSNVLGGAEARGNRSSEVNLQGAPDSNFELVVGGKPGDSSAAEIGNSPSHIATSSAVNLGSESVIDLPGPAGSSFPQSDSGKVQAAAVDSDGPDSGVVDLLNAGRSSARGDRTPVAVVTKAETLPTPAGASDWRGRLKERTWSVAVISGLAGALLTGAVWLTTGARSAGPKTQPAPDRSAFDQLANQLRASGIDVDAAGDPGAAVRQFVQKARIRDDESKSVLTQIELIRDALKKARLDSADPVAAVRKMAKSKDTADKGRRDAESNLRTSAVLLKEEESKSAKLRSELDAAREQLAAAKKAPAVSTVPAPTQPSVPAADENATAMAKLRDEQQRLEARAKDLEAKAADAATAAELLRATLREHGSFTKAVRQRLRTNPDAKPDEVLAALDRSLTPAPTRSDLPNLPRLAYDPAAERAFARGLSDYFAGRLPAAETNLRAAVGLNGLDARYWYYLGLIRLTQGNDAQAEQDFRQGAERERRNLPNPSVIDTCLERLPTNARQAVNRYRAR